MAAGREGSTRGKRRRADCGPPSVHASLLEDSSSSATATPRAEAILSMLSMEMLRAWRSTWAMNVRCRPASNANASWLQPFSFRKRSTFRAKSARALSNWYFLVFEGEATPKSLGVPLLSQPRLSHNPRLFYPPRATLIWSVRPRSREGELNEYKKQHQGTPPHGERMARIPPLRRCAGRPRTNGRRHRAARRLAPGRSSGPTGNVEQ